MLGRGGNIQGAGSEPLNGVGLKKKALGTEAKGKRPPRFSIELCREFYCSMQIFCLIPQFSVTFSPRSILVVWRPETSSSLKLEAASRTCLS